LSTCCTPRQLTYKKRLNNTSEKIGWKREREILRHHSWVNMRTLSKHKLIGITD